MLKLFKFKITFSIDLFMIAKTLIKSKSKWNIEDIIWIK